MRKHHVCFVPDNIGRHSDLRNKQTGREKTKETEQYFVLKDGTYEITQTQTVCVFSPLYEGQSNIRLVCVPIGEQDRMMSEFEV